MSTRSEGIIVISFGLSLLIGILFGVLISNGTIAVTGILLTIPYFIAFSIFLLGSAIVFTLAALANFYSSSLEAEEDAVIPRIARCVSGYTGALIVAAIVTLIAAIVFLIINTTDAIIVAILAGFLTAFSFFGLLIFAALIFCLLAILSRHSCDCAD